MPWSRRKEPDPVEIKRRLLAEQERLLAEQMSRLTHELKHGSAPPPGEMKPAEPPVWRLEEEGISRPATESGSVRKRGLGRPRQRDKFLFFLCVGLLFVVTCLFIWLWQTHLRVTE